MNSIFAKTIYTGKTVKTDSYLQFDQKGIVGISKQKKGNLLGKFKVITPAFIDPHSHIGMVRAGEPGAEAESNENMDSILGVSDALDALQMDDAALKEAVEMGVLYSCIVPGSGNIIGGLSAVIRHYAANSTDALIKRAGLKAAFGHNPRSTTAWKGTRPSTRMGTLAILRRNLDEVNQKLVQLKKAKGAKKEAITFSAEQKVLRSLLEGKQYLRVHAHKTDDIYSLLRLVDEFKLKVTIEHACDIFAPGLFEELKKRKIPVLYGPVDAFAYKVELKHESWRNLEHLVSSKVEYGLMTDHPVTPSRMLFMQTRWFARMGLSKQQMVEIVTRKNAEILGVDNVLGSLEKGKWASFTCWNDDPFIMTSYPLAVYGESSLLYKE